MEGTISACLLHQLFGPSFFCSSNDGPYDIASCNCRIGIDEWLQVPSVDDVFALGDCAGFLEQTGRQVLPALAQVQHVNLLLVLGSSSD